MIEAHPQTTSIPGIEPPVFRIGFGTYHLLDKVNASQAIDSFGAAFEAGVNLFDTSDNYGTELAIGRAVSAGVLPRDQVIITTKTGLGTTAFEQGEWTSSGRRQNTDPDRIRRQVDSSLLIFGDDVGPIDIYQLHVRDTEVEHAQHAEVMAELIDAGKIRAWGVSNYSNEDLTALLRACDEHGLPRPVTSQPFHNILDADSPSQTQLAKEEGLVVLAHSPLLKGVLAYSRLRLIMKVLHDAYRGDDEQSKAIALQVIPVGMHLEQLTWMAGKRDQTLATVALAWVLQDPNVVALTTPTNKQYLEEATAALDLDIDTDWEIKRDIEGLRSDTEALEQFQGVAHNLVRQIRRY